VTTLDGGNVWKPQAFKVAVANKPTITTVTPSTPWYRNATVAFEIKGKDFQPEQTNVVFCFPLNGTALNVTDGITIDSITETTISGTVVVPYSAPLGTWNASVTTFDGGRVWKSQAFKVAVASRPAITSISPSMGYPNTTTYFTLKGSGFQDGGRTTVNLSHTGAAADIGTTLISVTPTQVFGSVAIPPGSWIGKWDVKVVTFDGGQQTAAKAFSIEQFPVPVIKSVSPSTGYRDTAISFVVTGSNFETGDRTAVKFTKSGYGEISANLTSVTASQITGSVTFPLDNTAGSWNVNVTTLDGGTSTKKGAISIL
jgi:hypothetical protein